VVNARGKGCSGRILINKYHVQASVKYRFNYCTEFDWIVGFEYYNSYAMAGKSAESRTVFNDSGSDAFIHRALYYSS
jgi:hypothetical protein